jgi:hypothetical protein
VHLLPTLLTNHRLLHAHPGRGHSNRRAAVAALQGGDSGHFSFDSLFHVPPPSLRGGEISIVLSGEFRIDRDTRIAEQGKDRYGRTLGRVNCAGVDANAEQVRRGMAWVYERYAAKDSPLHAVQAEAKAARRGLWQDARPVPPWEWRVARRR